MFKTTFETYVLYFNISVHLGLLLRGEVVLFEKLPGDSLPFGQVVIFTEIWQLVGVSDLSEGESL